MGSLVKLWTSIDEVKSSGKLVEISLEELATAAVEQTIVLMGRASQRIIYQQKHNALTSLLHDPRKSVLIIKEQSAVFVQ